MIELANYLKSERIKRGISLEQLQEATKIRLKYLQAIESGDLSEMPGEVYLKGFLRSYAEFIGLDGTDVVNRYKELREDSAVREATAKDKASDDADELPIRVKPVKSSHKTFVRRNHRNGDRGKLIWAVGVGLAVLALALSAFLYSAVFSDGEPKDKEPIKTAAGVDIAQKGAGGAEEDSENPGRSDGFGKAFTGGGVSIEAFGISRSWIKVTEGGEKIFEGFLAKGETKTWHADDSLEMVFANAGGVRISYNGRILGRVGPVGKLVTRVFKAAEKQSDGNNSKKAADSAVVKAPLPPRAASASDTRVTADKAAAVKVQSLGDQTGSDVKQTVAEPATVQTPTPQGGKNPVSVTVLPATAQTGAKKTVQQPPASSGPARNAGQAAAPAASQAHTPTASSQHATGDTTTAVPEPNPGAADAGGAAEPSSEPVDGTVDAVESGI